MHGARDYLSGLAQLHELDSADERRAVWRQGLASLAMAATNQRPIPLEGLQPEALLASVRVALATGLVDEIGWVSRQDAAAALFEMAAALPPGDEKRELGRRVLEALHTGDASTFAALARSLAQSGRRALASPASRARIATVFRLPMGVATGVDGLALAILCRPELEREWLTVPSTGPLQRRRTASRLLERAARETARRFAEGDDTGLRVFARRSVRSAWGRLVSDRESLIWRHAATARGLLSKADSTLGDEIERGLAPRLGPTEWRRAVTALAASLAHDPQRVIARCHDLQKGELFARDPGLAGAMIFGLSRAATEEPEAVDTLLPDLVVAGGLEAIEALVDLIREHPGRRFGRQATMTAVAALRDADPTDDDGLLALRRALDAELAPLGDARRLGLRLHSEAALLAFAEGREVRPHAEAALGAAQVALAMLERSAEETGEDRQRVFQALRELDRGLLESGQLCDLLTIAGLEPHGTTPGELGDVIARFKTWLLAREKPAGDPAQATFHARRLKALIHATDGDGGAAGEEANGPGGSVRERRMRALRVFLQRLAQEDAASREPGVTPSSSPFRRLVAVSLARVCEGLVRDELAEPSDVLCAVSWSVRASADLQVLAEATIAPELKDLFAATAELARRLEPVETSVVSSLRPPWESPLEGFVALGEQLPPGLSPRVEGLRRGLVGAARALEAIAAARGLSALLAESGSGPLERLEESVARLVEIAVGVRRRLGASSAPRASAVGALQLLTAAIDRAVRGPAIDVTPQVRRIAEALRGELPSIFADPIVRVLERLPTLDRFASARGTADEAPPPAERLRLPAWLPPSRTIGGFYVRRPIGSGTTGSVFVASRAEQRHAEAPELFALKVPTYDGSVAHTLSEDEFLRLFREEAGALLTLPQHRNLAGFVTFDARVRPKPILVMELVEGPTLERVLARGDLSVPRAFAILDGIAAGLEAMHGVGVGHLDVKPGNVILRPGLPGGAPTPVLVDFGLAGRKVRPGCASPYYGAPEVWDTQGLGPAAEPRAADVYSFCCLAFELFTGRTLFAAATLPALIQAHFSHDGTPAALAALRAEPRLTRLVALLSAGMVPAPKRRPTIATVRTGLAHLASELQDRRWPVAA